MTPPRRSIAGLMAVVAVVAANVGAARALRDAGQQELLIGIAPMAVALQGAAVWNARRGRRRPFGFGFVAGGAVAGASFAWAMLTPEVLGFAFDAASGTGTMHRWPGSPMYALWMGYGRAVGDRVGPILLGLRVDPNGGVAGVVARALIWSVPQGSSALIGGLAARIGCRAAGVAAKGTIAGPAPLGAPANVDG